MQIVYLLSDRTGITIEGIADAVLSQFPQVEFDIRHFSFIDNAKKLADAINDIRRIQATGGNVIVLSSLVGHELRRQLSDSELAYLDIFESFLLPLEKMIGSQHSELMGLAHGIDNLQSYDEKMDAINFTVNHDDGTRLSQLENADVVLIGVSRTGKTPTCLYLALHYGMRAANYPLTEEDMQNDEIPDALEGVLDKLYGLTISPERLHQIRQTRRPDSVYASLDQCRFEINWTEQLMQRYAIPSVSSSSMSIEELAVAVRQHYLTRL